MTKQSGICKTCGVVYTYSLKGHRGGPDFCSRRCSGLNQRDTRLGTQNPKWRGGRVVQKGYIKVHIGPNKYKFEHRIVMEQILGRELQKHEFVHHKNGQRDDNSPENLELWERTHPTGVRASDMLTPVDIYMRNYHEDCVNAGGT